MAGSLYTGHTCRAEDLDCNGRVDVLDLAQAASAWPAQIGDAHYDVWTDLNQDGRIDIRDVMRVAASWAP